MSIKSHSSTTVRSNSKRAQTTRKKRAVSQRNGLTIGVAVSISGAPPAKLLNTSIASGSTLREKSRERAPVLRGSVAPVIVVETSRDSARSPFTPCFFFFFSVFTGLFVKSRSCDSESTLVDLREQTPLNLLKKEAAAVCRCVGVSARRINSNVRI